MRKELLLKLHNHEIITFDESFEIATEISSLLNNQSEHLKQKGREIIILVLDNWNNIPRTIKSIFIDFVSAAGFYPYLQNLKSVDQDLDDQIRLSIHKSLYLNDKFFHSEQKKISDLIKSHKNVIVSAPTSFGKSLLIEEIVASREYNNIVIIQPTLALLDETRRKLKKYSDYYKIIVKTSQEYCSDKGNIFLLTAERVLEYQNLPSIELLILDEFYKLSNTRGDDRNNILNIAFVRIMKNMTCKFYMLGPNIDDIPHGFEEKYDAKFYKTDFSMVLTESDNKYDLVKTKKGGKICEDDIFKILDSQSDQTLVYCSSPNTARKLAFQYCEHLVKSGIALEKDLPLNEWIKQNLSYRWSLAKCLKYGIAVHDGAMPKHITSSTIQYFNDKKIKIIFCTNTIIEGVNTSAKNVIYYDNKIGSKKIDYFDYSNIKGRAGRLMEHYTGKIINLHKPPEKEKMVVDFPFFEQDPIATEVLVNLDKDEVKNINDNFIRYNDFESKDPELQTILKRNAVSIEGQEAILNRLFKDLKEPQNRELILWSKIDGKLYARMTYLFDLCWENLTSSDERKGYDSQKWVVNKIVGSCYKTSLDEMIRKDLEYQARKLAEEKRKHFVSIDDMFIQYPLEMQQKTDHIIERIFALQKNWLQYRAPKWINVVDSLQKYATSRLGLPSGDYTYVAEMIENDFIQSNYRILIEYGVPKSAIETIEIVFRAYKFNTDNISEDELLELISRNKNLLFKYLSEYEREIVERTL